MTLYRLKGTSGQVVNQAWNLEEETVIGSDASCDVRVDGETIAPRHAELAIGDSVIHLRLLEDGAQLSVNGENVTEAALVSGDEIRIGTCRWLLQAPGLKPQKVLTETAVRRRRPMWPWWLAGGLSALALLAWRLGYLPF